MSADDTTATDDATTASMTDSESATEASSSTSDDATESSSSATDAATTNETDASSSSSSTDGESESGSPCGNGVDDPGEQCDDGNDDDTDECVDCMDAFCGDGAVRAGVEECDDGDFDNEDACTAACELAVCGDAFVRAGVEECDEGDTIPNDGCSDDCQDEPFCYVFNPQVDCPTNATQWCAQVEADCDSSAHAITACNVCMGGGCESGESTCGDSSAAAVPGATCPDDYSFVYGSATCAAGNVVYECLGGGTFGSWCG
jgi:cysteine-rich repeat protein